MSAETLFSICNMLVLPGWLLLLLAPGWRWTTRLITTILIPGLLGIVYTYLLLTNFGGSEGGFGSLAEVAMLFQNPMNLLAGWVHYLAFDLFVGSWEVRDARRYGVRHLFVIPCLVLTFLAGPMGLLLYFVARALTQKIYIVEQAHA